ncbi:MAG: hypothetical protein ACRC6M_19390 [Microcystaceae cyanobacterium]
MINSVAWESWLMVNKPQSSRKHRHYFSGSPFPSSTSYGSVPIAELPHPEPSSP